MGELDDIITLLAIAIVADGRVVDEELTVFRKAIAQIKLSNSDIRLPSEGAALSWLSTYQDDIRAIVFGPKVEYEARLTVLLDRLSSHIRPEAIMHILQMISIADGEVHASETRLMLFIKHTWQMD